jgi:hypothetical protein
MKHAEWVRGFIGRLAAGWRAAPPIEVVETCRDLPVPAPLGARGLLWRGRVFVNAQQMPATLARTLAHEAVGHFGVRQVLKGKWQRFMGAVHDGIQSRRDRKLSQLGDSVRKTYVDKRGRCELMPLQLADEVTAAASEIFADPWTADVRSPRSRTRTRFSDVMRALRMPRHVPLRFGLPEMSAVLRAAAAKLKSGCQRFGQRLRNRPGPKAPRKSWRRSRAQ